MTSFTRSADRAAARTASVLADFLRPDGFEPPAAVAVLRESSVVGEVGRYAWRAVHEAHVRRHTPYAARAPRRGDEPVLLVPGFLAGDGSLALMARALRVQGLRTYRSHIHANIGCTLTAADALEERLEHIADRRGSRVRIVGHSLGGMLARGVAARRPDLVAGIVTMGSPMLAPGAHHVSLAASLDALVRLSRAGVPGLMSVDCVAGECARQSFEEARAPLSDDVDFTAIYSRRDGIVDWRACIDPAALPVEVRASHVGMAVDPRVIDEVLGALRPARLDAAG
ncbi:alpha/beta hydrolase [Nocardioides gansuensis]|uniref:Alpha/beta hydrolase n=1 Tax=Nocardioides gansuensis TaxID=2138300 RepID=A0A2T8F7F6_9ACTN|nr:alpha/beta fold hydrolase [Nocardioides gansuensis]PVG81629.1 alpha/beta hydrolase [Nocardioides gansuensis]